MKQVSLWKAAAFAAVVAVFILSFAAISAGGGPVAAMAQVAQGLPTNSITVNGSGQAFGAPDIAFIQLGVDVVNADVGEAMNQANATMEAVIAAVTETGIPREDIQTTGFNMWPEDRFDPASGAPTGERVFHVQHILRITLRDVSQTSNAIDVAVSAGANNIFGLNFGIEDHDSLEQEARLEAIEDARTRAGQLAEALGVTLGDPIIITEVFGAVPLPFEMAAAGMGGGGGAPIEQGQLAVNVQVTVTFSIS